MTRLLRCSILPLMAVVLTCGCSSIRQVNFPSGNDVFVTTGDGNIAKPYEPVGMLIYAKNGIRIPLPLLGFIPFDDVDPDLAIKQVLLPRVREMGGDAVINLNINWQPATAGFLGLFADGGYITIYGTVIRK